MSGSKLRHVRESSNASNEASTPPKSKGYLKSLKGKTSGLMGGDKAQVFSVFSLDLIYQFSLVIIYQNFEMFVEKCIFFFFFFFFVLIFLFNFIFICYCMLFIVILFWFMCLFCLILFYLLFFCFHKESTRDIFINFFRIGNCLKFTKVVC
jgi:hypothetical protein